MKIEQLKPQHQDSVIGVMISLNCQMMHYKSEILPYINDMAAWEAKEYVLINDSNAKQFDDCKAHIIENESIFNEMLSSYNLSVATFVYTLNHLS